VENARVIDLEDFTEDTFIKHPLIMFCVATHYEGDPCDNTKKFYKWFKDQVKRTDGSLLRGTSFCVFGLGDTSYE